MFIADAGHQQNSAFVPLIPHLSNAFNIHPLRTTAAPISGQYKVSFVLYPSACNSPMLPCDFIQACSSSTHNSTPFAVQRSPFICKCTTATDQNTVQCLSSLLPTPHPSTPPMINHVTADKPNTQYPHLSTLSFKTSFTGARLWTFTLSHHTCPRSPYSGARLVTFMALANTQFTFLP
jgi:hypothetical protein